MSHEEEKAFYITVRYTLTTSMGRRVLKEVLYLNI
jgi:hypothetical protein